MTIDTLITELAESGAGDETIMEIASHVDRQMLRHYSHIRTEAKRDALQAALNNRIPSAKQKTKRMEVGSSDPIAPKASETPQIHADPIADALDRQSKIQTPLWDHGTSLLDGSTSKNAPPAISGTLGEIRETGGKMLVAYSVVNQSSHWVEVLPPQIEVNSPGAASELKKRDKKHMVEAEQIPVDEFRVNGRKLAPGQRADGVVTFMRPGFKQSQERILLQLASANSVDKPLLLAVPFVAPKN